MHSNLIGKHVIIRTKNAGVFFGVGLIITTQK